MMDTVEIKILLKGWSVLKIPIEGSVSFYDEIKGDISIDNAQLDDLIIKRSDGNPTYNLTVVVDDHDMQIETLSEVTITSTTLQNKSIYTRH